VWCVAYSIFLCNPSNHISLQPEFVEQAIEEGLLEKPGGPLPSSSSPTHSAAAVHTTAVPGRSARDTPVLGDSDGGNGSGNNNSDDDEDGSDDDDDDGE